MHHRLRDIRLRVCSTVTTCWTTSRYQSLGVWLMECVAAHPRLQGLRRWMLGTADAHKLYEKTGFTPLAARTAGWSAADPDVYKRSAPELTGCFAPTRHRLQWCASGRLAQLRRGYAHIDCPRTVPDRLTDDDITRTRTPNATPNLDDERTHAMKAAVYYENGAPDVFKYEEVPDPPLHPRGVLIDVKAIAIEGGDVLNRAGGALTAKPHIVGYNCAGVVREVGAEVTDRKPGDRVTALMASGSHAAMVSVPATSTFLVPDGCSIEAAAGVPVSWGTAHDCLFEFGRLKAGETVLVQAGTSGVGIACVQLAKRAGATRASRRRRATTSSSGSRSTAWTSASTIASGNFVDAVRKATDGQGVDLVVDSVGGKTLEGSMQCIAYRGRVITVGNVSREGRGIDISALSGTNGSITGVFFGLETFRSAARVVPMMNQLLADIAKGELKVVIDKTFPLSEAAAAHAYIESPRRLRPRRAGAVGRRNDERVPRLCGRSCAAAEAHLQRADEHERLVLRFVHVGGSSISDV